MQEVLLDFLKEHIELNEAEKENIIQMNLFKSVNKGEILLKEGEYSDKSYFILKGCLRTYYILDGEEKTTAFYTELEGITPHTLLSKKASEYFIASLEDGIIIESTPEMEKIGFEKFPKFETLCRILSEKLYLKQQMDFDEFKTSSPEKRYLNLIKQRPDLIQGVPQNQIASYLGITPQSLSRMRARLSEKKI